MRKVLDALSRKAELDGVVDEFRETVEENIYPSVDRLSLKLMREAPDAVPSLRIVTVLASETFRLLDSIDPAPNSSNLRSAFSHALRSLADASRYGDADALADCFMASLDRDVTRWDPHRDSFLAHRKKVVRPTFVSAPAAPPPSGRGRGRGQGRPTCTFCHKQGHHQSVCYARLRSVGQGGAPQGPYQGVPQGAFPYQPQQQQQPQPQPRGGKQ
jgi:hypothetical protein